MKSETTFTYLPPPQGTVGPCYYPNLDAAGVGSEKTLHQPYVDKALVLHVQVMFGAVDESSETHTCISIAPDQQSGLSVVERSAMPVSLEACEDFADLCRIPGDDAMVPGVAEVPGHPIERLDIGRALVDHHGFLVRDLEVRRRPPG